MAGKVEQDEMEPEMLHLRCCRQSANSLGLCWGINIQLKHCFTTAPVYEDRA